MEAAKKVSESMNMFPGSSGRKNNLVNLLLDDPYMIYVMTDAKAIEVLSIGHQPHKGCGGWMRRISSDRRKNMWDEN
jgi:hypothetical protein